MRGLGTRGLVRLAQLLRRDEPQRARTRLDATAFRDAWFVGKVADALQHQGFRLEADTLRSRAEAT